MVHVLVIKTLNLSEAS